MTVLPQTDALIERYIEANGLNICYKEAGQGKPLLLIHGGTLTGASWQPYLATFAAHYRVIMPDSRGHGHTANPTGKMSFRLLAEDMVALTEALDLQKPLIFGYSDGGQVALEIGMRYPDHPQALVIGGAYPELTEPLREFVRSILGDERSAEIDFDKFEHDNPDYVEKLKTLHGPDAWKMLLKQIKPMWNSMLNYAPNDFLSVKAPVLVILGDRDEIVRVEEGVEMFHLLSNAEFVVMPNTEHIDLIESPTKIALLQPIIIDFMNRHATP